MKRKLGLWMFMVLVLLGFMLPKGKMAFASAGSTFSTYDQVYSFIKEQTDAKRENISFTVKNYSPQVFYVGKVFYDIDKALASERGYYMKSGLPVTTGEKDVTFTYEYIQYPDFLEGSSLNSEGKIINSEKMWYQTAKKMLKDSEMKIKFNGLYSYPMEVDQNIGIIELMVNQHSEYNYDLHWTITTGTDGSTLVFDSKSYTLAQRKKYIKKTEEKAASIIKKIIKKEMSQEQKVKAIHDYIIKNCKYDLETSKNQENMLSYTAYGCLVNKKAVCQGYAGAFNLLLQKAGIKSIGVAGSSAGNGNHMWNLALVNKKYTYFDVTWDDPIPDQGNKVTNTYFSLSKAKMLKDHSWNTKNYANKYVKY